MAAVTVDALDLKAYIREIDDWPEPGVSFKDITPLLADPRAFATVIDSLADHFVGRGVTKVVGMEARGFVVAGPVALRLGAGFVPVRKPNKLPWSTMSEEYELEYGTDLLEIHTDAIEPGEKVVVVDDVIATGGTAAATVRLIESIGGVVIGLGFIADLAFLGGSALLGDHEHVSLVTYS